MTDATDVLSGPLARTLLSEQPILRLSYVARDGGPRGIPIAYLYDGSAFLLWTIPGSAKVAALRAEPRVALTIDVPEFPPTLLLVRGDAALTEVEGVPDGYLAASHRTMPPSGWDDFDAQVRGMYERMVAITITPTWAKLIDFENTLPSAVEEIAARRGQAAT